MQDGQRTDSQLKWEPKTLDWWRAPGTVSGSGMDSAMRGRVSLQAGGMQCLLTAEPDENGNHMCHLVPRVSTSQYLETLQYAWGRPVSPDNRWGLFFLSPTFHGQFDTYYWTLVPDLDTVRKIETKIRAELDVRRQSGETGPWPDFRSKDWFPILKNAHYDYTFLPLGMRKYILRFEQEPDQDDPSCKTYAPPYNGFPTLRSHVHPYMVIANAVPKLKEHFDILQNDESRTTLYNAMFFIYDTWMSAVSSAPPKSRSSHSTTSRIQGSGPSTRSERYSRRSARQDPNAAMLNTGNPTVGEMGNLPGGQEAAEQITDSLLGSDGELWEAGREYYVSSASRSSLSTSVPDESITTPDHAASPRVGGSPPGCNGNPSRSQETAADQHSTARMWKNVCDWVDGANAARDCKELSLVHDPLELDGGYGLEPARAAFSGDWHEWRSKYLSRYPQLKDRGVLSSNDWAEIKAGVFLTSMLAGRTRNGLGL